MTGKYFNEKQPKDARLTLFPRMARYSHPIVMEAALKYNEIAKSKGVSLAQLALAFINERPFLTGNIIGATTMSQLKENIESIHVSISQEEFNDIEEIHRILPNPAP